MKFWGWCRGSQAAVRSTGVAFTCAALLVSACQRTPKDAWPPDKQPRAAVLDARPIAKPLSQPHGPSPALPAHQPASATVTPDLPPGLALQMPRPLRRCFEGEPAWVTASVPDLLDRSETLLAAEDAQGALACAEEAARQAPNSIDAHQDRAAAFVRLGRLPSAQAAITLALALAPFDQPSLVFAADLFINHLPTSAEHANIGLQYARRAARLGGTDRSLRSRLPLLEGQALIDLGRADAALAPLTRAFARANTNDLKVQAAYELGVAHFELSRFDDAAKHLGFVLQQAPSHGQGHFHMGLVLERAGALELAESHFAAATAADSVAFAPPVVMDPDEFAESVRQAVAQLPSPLQESLRDIPVQTSDLPTLEDLTAELPPLSPTILGLFRGLPLGLSEDANAKARLKNGRGVPGRGGASGSSAPPLPSRFVIPERSIVIYRRNLLRSVRNEAEVGPAILRTLLHEVGHLLGEDDGSLRDRGLE